MRGLILVISFMLTLCWAPRAWSQQNGETPAPIQIEADRMESSRESSAVFFFGNVRASQENLIIQADEMTVLYDRAEVQQDVSAGAATDLSREIDKITAKGNVKIDQGDWSAVGDTMDFNATDRIVILAGNASATQEQNMVSGEKIVLYLNEGKSIVESSSQEGERVKAFIHPSSKQKADSNTP